jgi:signal transduction histidine kinase
VGQKNLTPRANNELSIVEYSIVVVVVVVVIAVVVVVVIIVVVVVKMIPNVGPSRAADFLLHTHV